MPYIPNYTYTYIIQQLPPTWKGRSSRGSDLHQLHCESFGFQSPKASVFRQFFGGVGCLCEFFSSSQISGWLGVLRLGAKEENIG